MTANTLPATAANRLPMIEPSIVASLVRPRISELGKIKIGGKSAQVRTSKGGNEWRAPEKFDHFVITTLQRDDKGDLVRDEPLMVELAEKFADKDGKLRRIPIMLLSNRIDDIVQASYVWYASRQLGARSDGQKVTFFVNPESKQLLANPVEKDWTDKWAKWSDTKGNKLFKLHTVFNCVIASKESRWGGVFKFRTTSRISASQLVGSLQQLQLLTGGVLRGLPLQLVVRPIQVTPEGRATNVFVVHVELLGADIQAIQDRALKLAQHDASNHQQMLAIEDQYRKMLRAPGTGEADEEIGDLQEEFHPEGNTDGPRTTTVAELAKQAKKTEAADKPEKPAEQPFVDAEFEDVEPTGEPTPSPESFSQETQDTGRDESPQTSKAPPAPTPAELDEPQDPNEYEDFMGRGKGSNKPAKATDAEIAAARAAVESTKPTGATSSLRGTRTKEWKACDMPALWNKFGGPAIEKVAADYILIEIQHMTGEEVVMLSKKIMELEAKGELKPKA